MCHRLLDTISFVFLWIYVLPFRVKSYVLSSPWITALQPRQALVHTELQYHPQYLYGFNHPTNLYLIYHTIDTVFSLHPCHRNSSTLTSLRVGQWFRIHAGDYEEDRLQTGYAVLNRIIERQETWVIVELVAAVAEWEATDFIWVAIPYRHIHPGVVFRFENNLQHPRKPDNLVLPLTVQIKPEAVALNPLVDAAQRLPRLPQLPLRRKQPLRSSFSSFESLITVPAPAHTYPPSSRRTRKISLHF